MANSRYYMSLPTPAPQHQRSGSRRPPLTPSTVSSPCLSTHATIAARRDSGSGSPTRASALLAKVASHASPTSETSETPTSSPLPSPTSRPIDSPLYASERPAVWRSESARYVSQSRQHDGYISFPDFEKFCEYQNPYDAHQREHTAVKT